MGAILGFLGVYRWLAMAAVVAALVLGFFGWKHHIESVAHDEGLTQGRAEIQRKWDADRKVWQGALDKQKSEAAQLLAAEKAKAEKATTELNAARAALEERDAKNRKTVAGLERRLADAAALNGGQLRDPNAAGCRGSGGAAEAANPPGALSGATGGAGSGGLLSVPLSDLLRSSLRRSDEINRAYIACRADAFSVRELLPK